MLRRFDLTAGWTNQQLREVASALTTRKFAGDRVVVHQVRSLTACWTALQQVQQEGGVLWPAGTPERSHDLCQCQPRPRCAVLHNYIHTAPG